MPSGVDMTVSATDQRFLGHLFNGVYEQLLPFALNGSGFEVLAGGADGSGRVFRPVVREKTLFGHVEARRITTFDYLLGREGEVFVVEATGWQAARGAASAFGKKTPKDIEGRPGLEVVRRLLHLDLERHECLINRKPADRQPTARMLLWWDVTGDELEPVWEDGFFYRVGGRGRRGIVVGSIRRIFEHHFESAPQGDAARTEVNEFARLSAMLWDAIQRGDLSLLADADAKDHR